MSIPVTILYPVICHAVACVYLAWFSLFRTKDDVEFPWQRIKLGAEEKVAVKGLIGYIEAELQGERKKAIEGWESMLFEGAKFVRTTAKSTKP